MRKPSSLLFIAISLFIGSAVIAQSPKSQTAPNAAASTPARKAAAASPFRIVGTIKDLMDALIDPGADPIFDAVATIVTPEGTVEKRPKTDEDWVPVRNAALQLIEGANLLMMPGRHVASGSEKALPKGKNIPTPGELGGELDPIAIEAKLKGDRPAFIKLAHGLQDAATKALNAANAKDVDALLEAGDAIDDACENCHLRYWYPDQLQLLTKADKVLRSLHKP
jgi:hypothetical protein